MTFWLDMVGNMTKKGRLGGRNDDSCGNVGEMTKRRHPWVK